ncbi:MAG: hypothetical protein IT379_37295 [Deltaproteobacteria bacterium]|nr:hypothetical protein [Deltaproteobacteria bacterium]
MDAVQRRRETAKRLRSLFVEHDVSVPQVALDLGIATQGLQRALDPDDDGKHIRAADIVALPPVVRRAFIEHIARGLGCVVADCPPADEDAGCDLSLIAHVAKELGEVVPKQLAALADGHIDAHEARAVMSEIDDSMKALGALRESLMGVVRDRVRVVRVK